MPTEQKLEQLDFNLKNAVNVVFNCGREATEKHGDFYPKVMNEITRGKNPDLICQFFLERHDMENVDFLTKLYGRGFKSFKHMAHFHWIVANEYLKVEYVEGDVYVYKMPAIAFAFNQARKIKNWRSILSPCCGKNHDTFRY